MSVPTPRDKLRLSYLANPFAEGSDIDSVRRSLQRQYGGSWTGWHRRTVMETAAVFAQLETIGGHQRLTALVILAEDDEPISARDLRKISVEAIENATSLVDHQQALDELKARPRLEREPGEAPEDFSRKVTDYYSAWSAITPNPVAAMVAEYGVKSATLHAWIREARLRGLLPPAKKRGRRG